MPTGAGFRISSIDVPDFGNDAGPPELGGSGSGTSSGSGGACWWKMGFFEARSHLTYLGRGLDGWLILMGGASKMGMFHGNRANTPLDLGTSYGGRAELSFWN